MKRKGYSVFIVLSLLFGVVLLGGCDNMVLLNPKGPIGDAERTVILVAIALMLIVVIPVFIMAFWFTYKYRASNTSASYRPKWSYSGKIDLVVWLVPVAIVTALGIMTWTQTHRLNPYSPIVSDITPVNIEAVSLDWKWMFIYPDYNVATINQLVFPVKVPLSFRITSNTVMTSFFIPQLGSQIYAMAGMQTKLNLMADESGIYYGQNQQLSGRGFSDMRFEAIATSREKFEEWIQKTRQTSQKLDFAGFAELEKPSEGFPVTYFSPVKPGLFDDIIEKYRSGGGNPLAWMAKPGGAQGKSYVPEEK